ncbi:AAA family ATPase [Hathewaya limosa]|uniref:endopeptidase La n=1 Tax=Hathewaya limosa TaxID=1536 RepID=A0ABU0JUV0_HATLI|nr:AAA family ATPase [Hathewaya limosa]MDQ0480887.1 lon-related putative ATP-dependent protease [Hathewaya limosa]
MIRPLSYEEIAFKFDIENIDVKNMDSQVFVEFRNIYESLKTAINIEEDNYNIVIADKCTKDKVEDIKMLIKENCSKRKLHDIVYVTCEREMEPEVLVLNAGNGNKLKNFLEHIEDKYTEIILKFYNSFDEIDKDTVLQKYLQDRKSILNQLMESCKDKGFEINYGDDGFSFTPIKGEEKITEEEFDEMDLNEKECILENLKNVKEIAREVAKHLKNNEMQYLKEMKKIFKNYINEAFKDIKVQLLNTFKQDTVAIKFLEKAIIETNTTIDESFNKDFTEEQKKILKSIYKYKIFLLTSNEKDEVPIVYEEVPTYKNIFGNVEISHGDTIGAESTCNIQVGSLLKANDGFLILDLKELLSDKYAYAKLKKVLKEKKFTFENNGGLISLLAYESFKGEPIPINVKIVLIGGYKYFHLLYSYDSDFKELFKIYLQGEHLIPIDSEAKEALIQNMLYMCKKYKCKPLTNKAIKEVARIFSKDSERRDKLYFDNDKLKDIMIFSSAYAIDKGKRSIELNDIMNVSYKEELIEKYIRDEYKDGEILLNLKDSRVGEVNALSVIDLNHTKFGKPMRITCTCSRGNGRIIDAQKESNLSGKIHSKTLSILKGFLNSFMGGYNDIPVDFNISFEQIYGVVEGDSASVAEAMAILSALLKVPIRQNIAVTGSINQLGEVQPVGGINEKIEGFFKTCKCVDTVNNKGVLVPFRNFNNIVLKEEVELEIARGNFYIYAMDNIFDAIDVLFDGVNFRNRNILDDIQKELRRYTGKRDRK